MICDETDMDVVIEEVRLRLKPSARRTVIVNESGDIDCNDYDYWLLRVTSRSIGKQWAIDFFGPQYNIRFPCFDRGFLLKYFAEETQTGKPFGFLAEYTASLIDMKGLGGPGARDWCGGDADISQDC